MILFGGAIIIWDYTLYGDVRILLTILIIFLPLVDAHIPFPQRWKNENVRDDKFCMIKSMDIFHAYMLERQEIDINRLIFFQARNIEY